MPIPSISKYFVAGMNKLSKTNFAQKYIGLTAPAAIGTITTLSGASKDAINCVYYVRQSLANEKIPEDKRSFVAGLDLANGILNVGLQLAIGLWFNKKVLPTVFDNHIAPKFFPDNLHTKLMNIKNLGLSAEMAKSVSKSLKEAGKTGLAALSTLLLTQVIIKRMIVPLISTPMATYFKDKMDKKGGHKHPTSGGDTITFENNLHNDSETQKNELNKNLPDCYKPFAKS